ncbi:MAG TPA: hypothetical protein VGP22_15045, partial [Albitalea sp.]|nr:hypothetical protein [Albitalea sp.]
MADPVLFKLRAAPLPPGHLPRAFQAAQRSTGGLDDDPFLPKRLLNVVQAFELGSAARATQAGRHDHEVAAGDGQVVVLELPEGITVITHPDNLRDAVQRVDPQAIDADGAIDFERALRSRGAAMRGSVGDALAGGLSAIASQVYLVSVGQAADPIIETAKRLACEWLGEKNEEQIDQYAELGISAVGTKALMWAIESKLQREPGLYRWVDGAPAGRVDAGDPALAAQAAAGPLLVMIHGTGSSTAGSFDALQNASRSYWNPFEDRYGDRVFGFEHRTLSESPIDNALQLARALPEGATIHLLTHSRGGLVGDLLCLENFAPLIDGYAPDDTQLGIADPAERERVLGELVKTHAEQRRALQALSAELARKKLRVERYVRVACPARGTLLASKRLDAYVSVVKWALELAQIPVADQLVEFLG